MKYNGAQTSCEAFDYGEVEDYSVTIGGDVETPTAPGVHYYQARIHGFAVSKAICDSPSDVGIKFAVDLWVWRFRSPGASREVFLLSSVSKFWHGEFNIRPLRRRNILVPGLICYDLYFMLLKPRSLPGGVIRQRNCLTGRRCFRFS